jgi:hypothetical protein
MKARATCLETLSVSDPDVIQSFINVLYREEIYKNHNSYDTLIGL